MYTVVIDHGNRHELDSKYETLKEASLAARRTWHHNLKLKDVFVFDEKGELATSSFDSRELRELYIVISNKDVGTDHIVARRKEMLSDMNEQAAFIWGMLKKKERLKYRVLVQGELRGDVGFDSDNPRLKNNKK